MEKIISLFKRDYEGTRLIYDEVVPGAEWVVAGEGVATRKLDGTSCMVKDGVLYKRYDARRGKNPPVGFLPAQEPDDVTGHWPGWLPVGDGPDDQWHRKAWEMSTREDGTFELLGPKVQGNPEHLAFHILRPHGDEPLPDAPRAFDALKTYFESHDIEGIVWHHPDGRMVKIKGKDFGVRRP